MVNTQKYGIVTFPKQCYVKCPCGGQYENVNFDDILREIGRYYFHQPEVGLDGICALIRDEINKEWHLNGLRKSIQLKRVTASQIKSIRRSFCEITDTEKYFVRVPFDVVSIFYFILTLLSRIDNEYSEANEYIRVMNQISIVEYLYKYHLEAFNNIIADKIENLPLGVLREKHQKVKANLTDYYTFMRSNFRNIPWDDLDAYIIK